MNDMTLVCIVTGYGGYDNNRQRQRTLHYCSKYMTINYEVSSKLKSVNSGCAHSIEILLELIK